MTAKMCSAGCPALSVTADDGAISYPLSFFGFLPAFGIEIQNLNLMFVLRLQ
jgi:hypothetical protein